MEVRVGGDRVIGGYGEVVPRQDRPGIDAGVDQVHRGADQLRVALGQGPVAAVDPPVLGVIPAWMLTNGALTHPSTDFAMIRVPLTTTTDGPSSRRIAIASPALTEVTVRSGGYGVASRPDFSRIAARRTRPRHRRAGRASTTKSVWPVTVSQPILFARRRASVVRDCPSSRTTTRSWTRQARKLATMSVLSPGPARRTTGPLAEAPPAEPPDPSGS